MTYAPDRDIVVRLTSNRAAARPDLSMVTIPAGSTSAQSGITTMVVPSPRDVIFTASINNSIKPQATLHLNP